jgi:dihydroorotate dehydrogenase electron transfer subunit
MALAGAGAYLDAQPGQFVMVGLNAPGAPLLRRPFSLHRLVFTEGRFAGIELLYKVVGAGTTMLARCRPGDPIELLGPLGRGFTVPDPCRYPILVAGGIGVAPMPLLAETLLRCGIAPANCRIFLGGQTREAVLCEEFFSRRGMPLHVTTDDGSLGDQCVVTQPLEQALHKGRPDVIYACGPSAMLACVAALARQHQIPCQVSVETLMACGVGACLGCALENRAAPGRYLHACVDGPVFKAEHVYA